MRVQGLVDHMTISTPREAVNCCGWTGPGAAPKVHEQFITLLTVWSGVIFFCHRWQRIIFQRPFPRYSVCKTKLTISVIVEKQEFYTLTSKADVTKKEEQVTQEIRGTNILYTHVTHLINRMVKPEERKNCADVKRNHHDGRPQQSR